LMSATAGDAVLESLQSAPPIAAEDRCAFSPTVRKGETSLGDGQRVCEGTPTRASASPEASSSPHLKLTLPATKITDDFPTLTMEVDAPSRVVLLESLVEAPKACVGPGRETERSNGKTGAGKATVTNQAHSDGRRRDQRKRRPVERRQIHPQA